MKITFPALSEHFGVRLVTDDGFEASLDFPVVVSHLCGSQDKTRYDLVTEENGAFVGTAEIAARNGNRYALRDVWRVDAAWVRLERQFTCLQANAPAEVRLTTDFDCHGEGANAFDDYQFVIPGALYNHNDNDGDGIDDYLGTYAQDYKDDRNPGLSVMCYLPVRKAFLALLRTDLPKVDHSITREQIRARHFVHETDIGSLGIAPSAKRGNNVSLHLDYPFYERNSFCLNVDGSEWSAYRKMKAGSSFTSSYALFAGRADTLTDASWQTTVYQMEHILDDTIPLPFSLEEAQKHRRELIFNSFREFPEKTGSPAGFFIHFSPRGGYGKHNILEYGFAGAQTLNCYAMLKAAEDGGTPEHRMRALKTLDFFVNYCIARSGLPNGIYDVDQEKFVYWWTGVLFPYQYSRTREELENYLGEQVVSALSVIATELEKVEGNYCRTMCEAMNYLLLCYQFEREHGHEHPNWLSAIRAFCDRMLEIQNPDGSWCRGYTMAGEPITSPREWFGATQLEIGSGALFPPEVLVAFYRLTKEQKYLDAAARTARFIVERYVPDVRYVGGLNDTTHKKSVKIDAVGVMFAMRAMLLVYMETKEQIFLDGARDAAHILASWTYLWDIPFDKDTLLGRYGFKTTGWAGCDVIPACSYVDDEFPEFVPDLLQVAQLCRDRQLAVLAKIVTRGMHHGLSMPQNTYGYPMMGVQCEGFLTSLWISDTSDRAFSGATAKNKGDDNDTCNGLINAQALYNLDAVAKRFGTLDYDRVIERIMEG